MGEFFHGWRRKIGCVTLVMASVFLAAWGRSHVSADKLTVALGGGIQYLVKLSPSSISLRRIGEVTHGPYQSVRVSKSGWSVIDNPVTVVDHQEDSSNTTEAKEDATGEWVIPIVSPVSITTEYDPFEVPYWYLITPLTLLSAFLLLTKSRHLTQAKIPEPLASDGGEAS